MDDQPLRTQMPTSLRKYQPTENKVKNQNDRVERRSGPARRSELDATNTSGKRRQSHLHSGTHSSLRTTAPPAGHGHGHGVEDAQPPGWEGQRPTP